MTSLPISTLVSCKTPFRELLPAFRELLPALKKFKKIQNRTEEKIVQYVTYGNCFMKLICCHILSNLKPLIMRGTINLCISKEEKG